MDDQNILKEKLISDLKMSNSLLRAISEVQNCFISGADIRRWFEVVLKNAISLTESHYGFIGEVLYTQDGAPFLKTFAVTNIAWNEATRKYYDQYSSEGMEFHNLNTLFGAVLTSKMPVISNDPSSDERKGGLPDGHPALNSFLGMPIFCGGNFYGMVGIANRQAGYDGKIIEHILPFLTTCGTLIEARRAGERQKHTENKLIESSERLSRAQAIAHVGDWEWDIATNEVRWSDELFRIYGFEPHEISPDYGLVLDKLHPSSKEEFLGAIDAAIKEDRPFEMDYLFFRKDGSEAVLHTIGKVIRDKSGNPLQMLGIVQDITSRKQAEEKLHESEIRLNTILDNVGAAIFIKDLQYRYTYVNQKVCDIFSKTSAEILGKDDKEFFSSDSVEEIMRSDRPVIGLGKTVTREEVALTSTDGIPHTYWSVKLPLRDSTGKISGLCGISTDITKRKMADATLHKTNETLGAIIRYSPLAIICTDIDTNVLIWNPAAENIFGWSEAEALGRKNPIVPADKQKEYDQLRESVRQGNTYFSREIYRQKKDGSLIHLNASSAALHDSEGRVIGLLGIFEDITERKLALEALRESEEKFSKIFRQAPLLITFSEIETGLLIDVNRKFLEVSGFAPEEVIGKSVSAIGWNPNEQRARIVRSLKDHGRVTDMELSLRSKDGREIICLYKGELITVRGKQRLLSIALDITERKKADAALREREKQLSESQRIAHIGSWEHNLTTGKVVWSDELFRVLGLDPRKDPADFKMFFEMIHPEDRPALKKAIDETVKTGKHFSIDYRFNLQDGRTRILHAQAELINDETGSQIILSGTGQDITERKQAEEKIRQSEEFVRNILDTVDEGFIVIDSDYCILTANKAYCRQASMPCEEVIGKHCYEISHNSSRPCYEEGEECAVRQVFSTGRSHAVLHKHTDRDGHVLYVETKGFPIKDSSGKVNSVIETINNITEKHLLEEERLKTQKLESIGTLAGGIAHDFNNLLQGIFGYISMAKMTLEQPEKSRTMLEQAERALRISVNLTSQLLTFSKGGKPLKKLVQLRPVIENAVKFALSGSCLDYRIHIYKHLNPVDADEGQIVQVLQNIVLNADQAMPLGGRLEITARNVYNQDQEVPQTLKQGDYVEISINDSGPGIPEAFLPRIFDPYFTTKEKGSGLGLATSYSIIKNHGGLIDVKSEVGKGSIFTIYLPTAKVTEAAAVTPSAAMPDGRKGRILVMDDEDIVRMVAGELIRSLGHEAAFAEHGADAIEKYQQARDAGMPFDVVILDLTVRGGMGGEAAVKKLRSIDPYVKAVVSSGYSDNAIVSNYREHGFSKSLQKPYDVECLQAVLNSLLK